MSNINEIINEIREIDDISNKKNFFTNINPVMKIIVTFIYIFKVLSMKYFKLSTVIVVIMYPILIFIFARINFKSFLKKIVLVLPVVLGISVVNLIINFSNKEIYTSLLLLFRSVFALIGGLSLITITSMNGFAMGLSKLKVPKIVIGQLLLLYRYIILMLEEGYKIKCAYELRTSSEKSMNIKDFGSIMGHMLLKSIDRAEKVYGAMKLRGFDYDYFIPNSNRLKVIDYMYLILLGGIILVL